MSRGIELHQLLLRPFNLAGLPYMVTGGMAAIIYGEPRLTNDIDIVLQFTADDAVRLTQAFPASRYYVPPLETLRQEASRAEHGHFNILELETALRADVYCLGTDPLGTWGMSRRRELPIGDDSIWVAPIEYVILLKLTYFRDSGSDRHLRDIAAMRRLSGALIDQAALDSWIERLRLGAEWARSAVLNRGARPTPSGG